MGFGGISIWQLLIILLIVVMLFGTKKLRTLGSDLGGAVKGFKKALNSEDNAQSGEQAKPLESDLNKTSKEKSQR